MTPRRPGPRRFPGLRNVHLDRVLSAVQDDNGALLVLLVVLAFETLDLGSSGAGLLNGAVGAGAMLGATLTVLVMEGGWPYPSRPGSSAGAWP
jgi:hypothetical protein